MEWLRNEPAWFQAISQRQPVFGDTDRTIEFLCLKIEISNRTIQGKGGFVREIYRFQRSSSSLSIINTAEITNKVDVN